MTDAAGTRVRDLLSQPTRMSLRTFLDQGRAGYYDPQSNLRHLAWAFMSFMKDGVPKNPSWNRSWGSILPRYCRKLQATANPEAAFNAAFEDVDLEALDRAFTGWFF